MNSNPWLAHLEEKLSAYFKKTILIYIVEQISGGSINHTEKLCTNNGEYFIKWNSASLYPNMFDIEYDSLQFLSKSKAHTPALHIKGEFQERAYFIMEFISHGLPDKISWIQLGEQLAIVHKNTSPHFGFAYNNYIGSLKQSNSPYSNWGSFFLEERIEAQIKRADILLPRSIRQKFNSLHNHIKDFPDVSPSLLHGDLWSGNIMFNENGEPILIDPAIYFGNREVDIAMSKLFGGFSNPFYDAYNSNFGLENNWEARIDIWNLYPLLVHLNLFGPSYLPIISSILNKLK